MKSLLNTFIAAGMALVLTLAVAGFLSFSFGQGLEAWMGDRMLTWRYELLKRTDPARKPDPHLLLVAIDQQSVSDLGRWPFPRAIHGQFLQLLAPENPRVVAFDVFFTEKTAGSPLHAPPAPSNIGAPGAAAPDAASLLQPDDQALVESAKLLPRLVTAAAGDSYSGSNLRDGDTLPTLPLKNIVGNVDNLLWYPFAVLPFPELRRVSYFGFADAGAKNLLRNLPLVVRINNQIFPSFDLQILMQYWGVDPDNIVVDLGHEITLTRPDGFVARIPIDESGEFLVNYRDRSEDFEAMSYSAMGKGLADKANNRMSDERSHLPPTKDKIVMVGVTLSGTDNGPDPIEAYSPLVVAHLNVLSNILQHDYLHELSPGVWMPLYALFLFVAANGMLRVGITPLVPMGLTAMVLLADAAFAALWLGDALMPVFVPELGVLVLAGAVPMRRFFGEEREKIHIKNILRANLSDKVMNKMLEHPDNVKLGGLKQEITVMFCDIRNFTRYCDDRDPEEVMDTLNEYMEEMTEVIFKHDGTVDKYIGDCIMAFWNAPQSQPNHARRAVACALEMQEALFHFETRWNGPDSEFFECGIGIHTGEALVGNMGSSHKRTYTAMGSTVNMASRLEALTKELKARILVSGEVAGQLGKDFPVRDRGEMMVAGFARPIHVYAVVIGGDVPPTWKERRDPDSTQDSHATEMRQPLWRLAPVPEDADGN